MLIAQILHIKRITLTCLLTFLCIGFSACKYAPKSVTPLSPVYLEAYLQQSTYHNLLAPGGIVLLKQHKGEQDRLGFGGLILVHSWDLWQFYAFDLSCPFENRADIRLKEENSLLSCPVCATKYEVLNGSGLPISGIGSKPLKRYQTRYNTNRYLLIVSN